MPEKNVLVPKISNAPRLQIMNVPIGELKRNARNPRRHPEQQIQKLAKSIDTFGFLVPCIADEGDTLLSGHARVQAAERLGMPTVPLIRVGHLSSAEKRAFIIADNKLVELADWNPDILRSELQYLDFSAIGFETAEVDIILDSIETEDDLPLPIDIRPVSRPGDLIDVATFNYIGGIELTGALDKT